VRKEVVDYIGGKGGKGSELREERSRRALRRTVKESVRVSVIAGELEGSRRDCNTMEKQRSGRVYSISVVEEGDIDIL
jgi:hypothetical protein